MVIGKQQEKTLSTVLTLRVKTHYLLYLPEGYLSARKKWPLVIFLHGRGECGSDIEMVKRHGPPKLVAQGKQFPFILVSPQCPVDEYWSVPLLKALLEEIEGSYRVDRLRVSVTGMSMGGNGTWKLASAYPDHFAAIAPVCGWGEPSTICVLKDVPTWIFHGVKDLIVPFEKSETMVEALKAARGVVRFTAYPEAGHDVWTETYDKPAFYDWLTAQRLKTPPAGKTGEA